MIEMTGNFGFTGRGVMVEVALVCYLDTGQCASVQGHFQPSVLWYKFRSKNLYNGRTVSLAQTI